MSGIYTETRIISLNSEDAYIFRNGSFLSDVQYAFTGLLIDDPTILQRQITLVNAQIPVSFYILNYTNNVFVFRNVATSTNYTITLSVGNYNSTTFITLVQSSILTATGLNVTITISNADGKLTFSCPTNFSILSTNTLTTSNLIFGNNPLVNLTATLISGNYVATCSYPLNLLGIKQLQVKSSAFSTNNFSSNSNGQDCLLATIPVDVGGWGMINYSSPSSNNITFNNTSIDEFDIKIVDAESGASINFSNTNWTMTILLHLIRKIDFTDRETNLRKITNPIDTNLPNLKNDKKISPTLEDLRILES